MSPARTPWVQSERFLQVVIPPVSYTHLTLPTTERV